MIPGLQRANTLLVVLAVAVASAGCGFTMGPAPHPPNPEPLEVTIATYYSLFQQYIDKLQADGQIVVTTPAFGQTVDCQSDMTVKDGRAADYSGGYSATITAYATGTSSINYLAETGSAIFIPAGFRYQFMHNTVDELYWSGSADTEVGIGVGVEAGKPLNFTMVTACHLTNRVWPDGPFDPVTFQPLPATPTTPSPSVSPAPTPTGTESPR